MFASDFSLSFYLSIYLSGVGEPQAFVVWVSLCPSLQPVLRGPHLHQGHRPASVFLFSRRCRGLFLWRRVFPFPLLFFGLPQLVSVHFSERGGGLPDGAPGHDYDHWFWGGQSMRR